MSHGQAAFFFCGKILIGPLQLRKLIRSAASGWPHPHIAVLARIRATRAQALQRIGSKRQRFHLDLDLLDSLRACQLVHGRDSQNGFSLVHRLICQRQLAPFISLDHGSVVVHICRVARNLCRRKNRLHSRHRQCFLRADALHARMRHGAQHQPAKQHSLGAKILRILRLPRHLRHQIVGRVILADQLVSRAIRARLLLLGLHRTLLRVNGHGSDPPLRCCRHAVAHILGPAHH